MFGRHAAVRWEVEVERYVRHRRQVVHRECVRGRPHVGRLHVVLGGLGDVEQPRAEARRIGFGAHGQSLPLTGGIAAEHELGAIGGETHQGGVYFNRATTRHRHVARFDVQRPHRHRRFGRSEGHEQQLRALTHAVRSRHEHQRRHRGHTTEHLPGAHHARTLQRGALLQRRNRRTRARHQARRERARLPFVCRHVRFLHGGDQRLLELRCALFHVQREALVAGPTHEWQHESTDER